MAQQEPPSPETVVILGTATPGGGFPLFGAALVDAVREVDAPLIIQTKNTKGSTENVPLLQASGLDIALVQGEVAGEALSDAGRVHGRLWIVAAMYSTPGLFVTRADSACRAIPDLCGKPVAFGARGSGLVLLARAVLGGIGLDCERDFQAIYLDCAGDGPAMVIDGRVVALWGGGTGWPGFAAVAKSSAGARFIAPDAHEIARIRVMYPFLKPLTLPAGSYAGQHAPIASVGSWSLILARDDLEDALAYRLARALHRAEAGLAHRLPQARETTAANTVAAAPRIELVHPGVLRYLREIGLLA
ncbi:MAG TPA: TAXI family TRAP transporter solute-binding subunit [Stellaceae bacterium]|nr:TAXI family TRAP transporter solute-binding subunit [Stellaceae bacterium]